MECPGSLFVNDIKGKRKEIKRYEVNQAQETLDIFLAPNGNTVRQEQKMRNIAIKWADDMRTRKISKDKAWLAIQSMIRKTLEYPLPELNLSKQQCENIMSPILQYGLPAIGVC